MLFQSSVPQLFQQIGLELYSKTTATRKANAALKLNFYHDSQLERLEDQLNTMFSDPSTMTKVALNVVKKVINNLCSLYAQPPKRNLEGTDKDKEIYAEILEGSSFNAMMKMAQKYTKLLKTILLRPVWRNNSLQIDILTGNILDVITGESPHDLQKVIITDYGTSDKLESVEYSLWTAKVFQRLDYRGKVINEQANPYKVLPFLPVFDYPPISSSFWLEGLEDLISIQEAINIKLTDLMHLIQMQSFGVGWIKSDGSGDSMKVDPGSMVQLPKDKDSALGFESQKAEITAVLEAISKLAKWACVSNGLSAGAMSVNVTEMSGIAKAWDSKELSSARFDDLETFRAVEHKLFDLVRIVNNTHSKNKLSASAKLSVDFYDPSLKAMSRQEQATSDQLQIEMGTLSPVDVLLRQNPDLQDRETALAQLLVIRDEIRTLTE